MLAVVILLLQVSVTTSKFADSVFITGANKGQGLEWVKQLSILEDPPKVIFATCRKPEDETYIAPLKKIADESSKSKIIILRLDVTNVTEIEQAAEAVEQELGDEGLNVLINNAGIGGKGYMKYLSQESTLLTLNTNAVGPLLITRQLLPMLKKAGEKSGDSNQSVSKAAVINISSILASMTHLQDFPLYGYSMSKAALNMESVKMGVQFKPSNIMVIAIHPGYVITDITEQKGDITTLQSITAMMQTLQQFNASHSGGYFERTGERITW